MNMFLGRLLSVFLLLTGICAHANVSEFVVINPSGEDVWFRVKNQNGDLLLTPTCLPAGQADQFRLVNITNALSLRIRMVQSPCMFAPPSLDAANTPGIELQRNQIEEQASERSFIRVLLQPSKQPIIEFENTIIAQANQIRAQFQQFEFHVRFKRAQRQFATALKQLSSLKEVTPAHLQNIGEGAIRYLNHVKRNLKKLTSQMSLLCERLDEQHNSIITNQNLYALAQFNQYIPLDLSRLDVFLQQIDTRFLIAHDREFQYAFRIKPLVDAQETKRILAPYKPIIEREEISRQAQGRFAQMTPRPQEWY